MKLFEEVYDFLPGSYSKDLNFHVNNNFFWQYKSDTSYGDSVNLGLWDKQMTAPVIPNNSEPHDPERNKYSLVYPIVYITEEKFNVKIKGIIRIKFNMTFTCPENVDTRAWHFDTIDKNAKSVVLYVNDSDGGTIMVNAKETKDTSYIPSDKDLAKLNAMECQKSPFVQNKAIMFDSNMYHYGELPKQHKNRIIMTMVFIPEEK